MALVFPNVVRFTVVGEYQGQDMMNVFDIELEDVSGSITPRNERIFGLAGDLLNQWDDHILPLLVTAYRALEVRWVDLDSPTGTTGSRSSTDASTWPANGGNPGAGLPGNVYAKVIKQLQGKNRQERNGLTRLGGIAEAATTTDNPNSLTALSITETNSAFENLKDGINVLAGGWQANIGVLHTVNNTATAFSPISTFSTGTTVGTIRRRMPGYGG